MDTGMNLMKLAKGLLRDFHEAWMEIYFVLCQDQVRFGRRLSESDLI